MKVSYLVLFFFAMFVASCASVSETYVPDGRVAYALNCSGLARGWDKCLQAAGEKCGSRGYDVLDKDAEKLSTISGHSNSGVNGSGTSSSWGVSGSANSTFSGAETTERTMLIACKAPKK